VIHLIIILLIVLGNVAYFATRRQRKLAGEGT